MKNPALLQSLLAAGIVALVAIATGTAKADVPGGAPHVRPAPVLPWDDTAQIVASAQQATGQRLAQGGSGPGVRSAADHVMNQQCVNGGWGWPHASCTTTFNNITGPIALGLLQAFQMTADGAHVTATTDGGDFDLTSAFPNATPSFGSFAPGFLHILTTATSDATYSTFAETGFFDALSAGTYADPAVGSWAAFAPADTFDYIARHKALRAGSQINLRPWDMQYMPWVAGLIGNADSTTPADGISQQDTFLELSILDGLNTLVKAQNFDLLGLAGGIRGLALNGTTSFTAVANPTDFSDLDGISDLCDLVTALLGFQNADDSWSWRSDLQDVAGEQDTQTTAYAVLALLAAQDQGCAGLDDEIDDARKWLWSMQDVDGGFSSWPGGPHNVEVEGEVLMAMTPPDVVWVDDDWNSQADVDLFNPDLVWQYDAYNNVQDGIFAVGNSTVNINPGTYNESNIIIDTPVTIVGSGIGNTFIDPAGGIGFRPQADNITIQDMTIQNGSQAIRFEMAGGTIAKTMLLRVEMKDNTSRGIEVHNATTVDNLSITECNFENTSTGLRVSSSGHLNGVDFVDCTFTDNSIGIYEANDGGSSTMTDLLVTGCTFTNHSDHGIFLEEIQDALIENNEFFGNRSDIMLFKWYQASVKMSNVVIRDNEMTDTTNRVFSVFNAHHISGQTELDGIVFTNNCATSDQFDNETGPIFVGTHSTFQNAIPSSGGIGWGTVEINNNQFIASPANVLDSVLLVRIFDPVDDPDALAGAILDVESNYWGTSDILAVESQMENPAATDFDPILAASPCLPGCGNGTVDPGEQCDDGNNADCDGCRGDCSAAEGTCGDGTLDPVCEACDDGNTADGDCCSAACQHDPAGTACTDDGLFCTGDEECDGAGSCESTGDPCPGTVCNTCQEATDSCLDPAGTACTDDGDECTDDICDGMGGCRHAPSCLDIKPSSCPNPVNPNSNGIVPVALIGSANFDVTQVDVSTIELSRADGVGDPVTPHEGPPGPHSVVRDVATGFLGELCDCHKVSGDGIDDLLLKFKAADLVAAFLLQSEPQGTTLELVLTGNLIDGTPIDARDCVVRIPVGFSNVLLSSNASGTFVEVSPLDLNVDGDGFGRFDRAYAEGTIITVSAPARSDGRRFVRWSVNGVMQDFGLRSLEVLVEEDIILRAIYERQGRINPDRPTEDDGDLD